MNRPRPYEWALLALVLAGMAFLMLRRYNLAPYSDPGLWFVCGRDFPELFSTARRAYFFPLVLYLAIQAVGIYPAFLVNVPILCLLGLALYMFVRRAAAPAAATAPHLPALASAAGLLIYIAVNIRMLPFLTNPYRDPLSYLFMALSALALVRYAQDPRHRLLAPAWSGAALALAASARETAVLLLVPLFLYACIARAQDRNLPFWRPMLAFLVGFTVAFAPLAVQNLLITGNPFVPAQTAMSAGTIKASIVPGISFHFTRDTLPPCVTMARDHYGAWCLALAALGALMGALRRDLRAVVFGLLVPGAALYLLFYGSYIYPVRRYLLVLDLFVVPLAALGAGGLLHLVAALGRRWWPEPRLAAGLATLALLGALATCVAVGAPGGYRFTLADARAFRAKVDELVPDDAFIIADRPLGEFTRSLRPLPSRVLNFIVPTLNLRDPALGPTLDRWSRDPGNLYFLNRQQLNRRLVLREFDLEPVATFDADDFHLREILEADTFTLERIAPWTRTSVATTIEGRPGPAILELQTGRLSKLPRAWTRLYVNGAQVAERIPDYDSYFLIDVPERDGPVEVRLESDLPLPPELRARLYAPDAPVLLAFSEDNVIEHPYRLSPSFLARQSASANPTLVDEGFLRVPSLKPDGHVFLFDLGGRFYAKLPFAPLTMTVNANGTDVYRADVTTEARPERALFAVDGAGVTNEESLITVNLEGGDPPAYYMLTGIEVTRVAPTDELVVRMGHAGDETYLAHGFHRPEAAEGRRWRWTAGRAGVWLPLAPDDGPVQLRIRYRDAVPASAKAGPPRFLLNGMPLETHPVAQQDAGSKTLEIACDVPARAWAYPASLLEIEADAWKPAQHGSRSDRRTLGIMMQEIEAMRTR